MTLIPQNCTSMFESGAALSGGSGFYKRRLNMKLIYVASPYAGDVERNA